MHQLIPAGPAGAGSEGLAKRRARRLASSRSALLLATALVAGTGTALVPAAAASASMTSGTPASLCPDANTAMFGPNVCVFTPSMSQTAIQDDLDAISTQQVPPATAQFDSDRYAIFFEPGTYGSASDPLVFQVGYYTEVAGLGLLPSDTVINGEALVVNSLCSGGTCNSDVNFWRSLYNVELNVVPPADASTNPGANSPTVPEPYGVGCYAGAELWSASQADPLRDDIINGHVVFQDYCSPDDYASGGFIANSQITGDLDFYGNQQYLVRNSDIGGANGCPGGLWNMVYSGVNGAPSPVFTGQCEQNTVIAATPTSEEQPYIYQDASGNWWVFDPSVQHDTTGPSWSATSPGAGQSIPLSRFYIANPSTPVGLIDLALALGKDLILTPGVYDYSQPIVAASPNTIIMGLGFATLVPQNGNSALIATSNIGDEISGLIFDAGPVNSRDLLQVGLPGFLSSSSDPDLVSDTFFRVGGAETTPVSADISFLDMAPGSILDDIWAWRADHGLGATGWTYNVGGTGLVVDANDVTATGLAVEHYQQNEVVWDGNGGTDIFFQNELPYDVPSQSAWMETPTQDGYPAFLVPNNVSTFNGYGMGSYSVFINTPATIYDQESFEVPDTSGINIQDVFDLYIAGTGGINSVIDGVGGPVSATSHPDVPNDVASFPVPAP